MRSKDLEGLKKLLELKSFKDEQVIGQLEKRKGVYFFLKIEAAVIN